MPTESSSERSKRGAAPLALVGLFLLPVLYVLSLGPAVWLYNAQQGQGPAAEVLETIYAPLGWLHENTPFQGPLEWYVDLWE